VWLGQRRRRAIRAYGISFNQLCISGVGPGEREQTTSKPGRNPVAWVPGALAPGQVDSEGVPGSSTEWYVAIRSPAPLPGISSSHHSKSLDSFEQTRSRVEIFSITVADHHDAAPRYTVPLLRVRKRAVWIRCCRLPGDVIHEGMAEVLQRKPVT